MQSMGASKSSERYFYVQLCHNKLMRLIRDTCAGLPGIIAPVEPDHTRQQTRL